MKPWTRFEAFLGKIVKDPEALAISITPLTRLETYLYQMGRDFTLPPRTSPLNARSYLMSDGTNGAVWVKPLNVMFSGYDPEMYCSKTYEEIFSAYSTGKPINAYYSDGGRQYNLTASAYAPDIHTLLFSGVCLIPDNGDIVTFKIACSINIGDGVEIVVSDGN